jgi:phosphate starvation-inducible protein PhoH
VALDFLFKKECEKVFVTRAAVEVGTSLGFLPGGLSEKFNPYLEAFIENLVKCYDKTRVEQLVIDQKIIASPVQFIRGKTIDDVLVIEEAQNLTKHEILALLTRLGKTGKIIINGDNEQKDIKESFNGLSYVIELSKKIQEIQWVKLKENHRSDLVGKILDFEYGK